LFVASTQVFVIASHVSAPAVQSTQAPPLAPHAVFEVPSPHVLDQGSQQPPLHGV
jgi:hypothetical protein